MNTSKSVLALILALAVALCTLTACSSAQAPGTSESAAPAQSAGADAGAGQETTGGSGQTRPTTNGQAENSLTVALTEPVATLDPQLLLKQVEYNVIVNLYDPLFYLDNDGAWRRPTESPRCRPSGRRPKVCRGARRHCP